MYFGTCELYQLQKVSLYVYSFYYVTKVVPGQLTTEGGWAGWELLVAWPAWPSPWPQPSPPVRGERGGRGA